MFKLICYHAKKTRLGVLKLEILVIELGAINRFTTLKANNDKYEI
jgi:hypothetical protein